MEENREKKEKKISPGLPMVKHRQTWGNCPSAPQVCRWQNREMIFKKQNKKMPTALAIGKQDCLPMATWRQPSANPSSA